MVDLLALAPRAQLLVRLAIGAVVLALCAVVAYRAFAVHVINPRDPPPAIRTTRVNAYCKDAPALQYPMDDQPSPVAALRQLSQQYDDFYVYMQTYYPQVVALSKHPVFTINGDDPKVEGITGQDVKTILAYFETYCHERSMPTVPALTCAYWGTLDGSPTVVYFYAFETGSELQQGRIKGCTGSRSRLKYDMNWSAVIR
jgi:hypothetical protein